MPNTKKDLTLLHALNYYLEMALYLENYYQLVVLLPFISLGKFPYTFTYYLKSFNDNNREKISRVAILISDPFTNTMITNLILIDYSSILLIEKNQSTNFLNPTCYWVTLNIINKKDGIFTKKVRLFIEQILAKGINNGLIANLDVIKNISDRLANVDSNQIDFSTKYLLSNNLQQGSFDSLVFSFSLSNSNPDATNHLSAIKISNLDNADKNDLEDLKIYQNNDDEIYNIKDDTIVISANMDDGRFQCL